MEYLANTTATPDIPVLSHLETIPIKVLLPTAIVIFSSVVFLFRSEPDYSVQQGGEKIRIAHYNLPFVGHIVSAIWNIDAFLRANRDRSPHGIFRLNMFRTNASIIHSPSLMKSFFALPGAAVEHKTLGAQVTCKIFGYPTNEIPPLVQHFDELMNTFVTELMRGPSFERSTIRLVGHIEQEVPRLLSLDGKNPRPWERTAKVKGAEVSLFPLVRNSIGTLSSTELMGSELMTAHPDLLQDVWQIDANIMGFVFGYPSFLPSISRANKCKARILEKMTAWHQQMEDVGGIAEPNAQNTRFEDVSDLMKQRQRIWSKHNFSMRARAAVDLAILWALNANSNSAAYWTIVNLHNNPDILARVREEIKPYAKLEGREGRLSLDWQGLLNRCPLLKASYFESLRIDSAPWSFKTLQRDVQIKEDPEDFRRKNSSIDKSKEAMAVFKLRKGDVALIPADLHHTDPIYFPSPRKFNPWRYISKSDGMDRAEIGTIRPYGGGSTMCKGRMLAEREVLSYVAAVLTCWDLEPAEGSHWGMHKQKKTSGVCAPGDDLRVILTPRF